MQIDAGAIGITCQKLGEVEVFVDAGVADDILLTYNIVGEAKTERLMALIKRVDRLAVVLDNEAVARGLSEAARAARRAMCRFLDRMRHRHGAERRADAGGGVASLAQLAMNLPRMHFEGLMTYPNTFPQTVDFFDRALELFEAAPAFRSRSSPAAERRR